MTNDQSKQRTTKEETLKTYVGDVHALVTHGLQAINLQVKSLKDVSHRDAEPTVKELAKALEGQKVALEACLQKLGVHPENPIKDAVSAVAGIAAGIINKIRPSETVKSLRDDYVFFSLLEVSYLMLHTTASGLGARDIASLAETGYKEGARLIMKLDAVLPRMTVEELREDNSSVEDTSAKTQEMVKAAWNREQSSQHFASGTIHQPSAHL